MFHFLIREFGVGNLATTSHYSDSNINVVQHLMHAATRRAVGRLSKVQVRL